MKGNNPNKSFLEQLKRVPKAVKSFNRLSMGLAASIEDAFKAKGLNQKKFAELCGKRESEISKWLSGRHNFTIKSVALIESKLDMCVLYTRNDLDLGIDQSYDETLHPALTDFMILDASSVSENVTYDISSPQIQVPTPRLFTPEPVAMGQLLG